LLLLRAFAVPAGAAALGLAFRPDHYDFGPALLTAGFLLVLLTLASTDFHRRRIPNKLTYPAAMAAMAVCWAWPDRSIAEIAIGATAALAVAVLLVFLRFGGGDSKLVVVIGLLVGWPGVMPAILYGVVLGGGVALALLFVRGRGSTFAYGPYLAVGAAIVMLFPGVS
jgi:leader peptidase (prepilin peptidase)/N-methyltransferase